ncbi:hypothetical protein IW261DRAFT_866959 [Armillaria novae-zelandiae]|uniref:Uncharacterized protein n=1 Tax=Armillaria novae-zelandiae TaxID=153914 RepID=A0AA39PIJ8_9AGAR|nr:hypothetical protein IW261DRAFT_866959 [Armillaria novae-zelandiae]
MTPVSDSDSDAGRQDPQGLRIVMESSFPPEYRTTACYPGERPLTSTLSTLQHRALSSSRTRCYGVEDHGTVWNCNSRKPSSTSGLGAGNIVHSLSIHGRNRTAGSTILMFSSSRFHRGLTAARRGYVSCMDAICESSSSLTQLRVDEKKSMSSDVHDPKSSDSHCTVARRLKQNPNYTLAARGCFGSYQPVLVCLTATIVAKDIYIALLDPLL